MSKPYIHAGRIEFVVAHHTVETPRASTVQSDRVLSYRELTEHATVVAAALGHLCGSGTPRSRADGTDLGTRVPVGGFLPWYGLSLKLCATVPHNMLSLLDVKPVVSSEIAICDDGVDMVESSPVR